MNNIALQSSYKANINRWDKIIPEFITSKPKTDLYKWEM